VFQPLDTRIIFNRIFLHADGVRADVRNLFVHVAVEAFNQRHHDDDRRHAKDDAEQSKERPQLVTQNRGGSEF
jgi:hypothetical protein